MAGRFMRVKKIVMSVLVAAIITSQVSGCALMSSDDLADLMSEGETIEIEMIEPKWDNVVKGKKEVDTVSKQKGFKNNLVLVEHETVTPKRVSEAKLEEVTKSLEKKMKATKHQIVDLKNDPTTLELIKGIGEDRESTKLGMKALHKLINI